MLLRQLRETSSRERSENDIFSHFIEFFENNKYKKIQFIHTTNILKKSDYEKVFYYWRRPGKKRH